VPNITKFLKQLNESQQQAVVHDKGPAVVLAGAGSGKTRVLTTRAAWLVKQQQVQPDNILLMTFTNKAAGEMNKRVQQLTGYELPYSGTFHSFCARILRREGKLIGYSNNYLIYDSSDQMALIKQIYKQYHINTKKFKPNVIKALISKAKNDMLDVDEYERNADDDFHQTAAKIYRKYQHQLLEQNAMDFDDLLLNAVTLFQHHPEVLKKYQQQFNHVLVDEYQDTNKAQYQLTKQLALPQKNVYVVGDFSQSIYAWRGADYRNLFYLKQDFKQIAEYRLERNYRSTRPILTAATKLISNNTTHPVLKLWTDKKQGEPVTVIEVNSSDEEAEAVVAHIKQLKSEYQYQDMAILYRTNAQSRAFEEAFIQHGIPYRLIGGFKFYERKEIKDVLAYLRLVVNNQDSVSEERVLKLGKRRYQKFKKWLQKQAKTDKLQLDSPYELMNSILQATGYLDKYDAKDQDDAERIENIKELLNVASQFNDTTLFLENVSLVQDEQMKDLPIWEANSQVLMMSLHSAKGLEFPVVFMVGVEEGLLPHSRAMFEPEQLEEERRLCYVGITRAQNRLFMSYAKNRWLYGHSSQTKPSRFLSQIPSKVKVKRQFVSTSYSQPDSFTPSNNLKQGGKKYRLGIEIDEKDLDALLNDELDIEDFLRK
jgi:DNA helicase-2/ATP-dependent DNA helicase PcrA